MCCLMCFFFFSSRRRHTRCSRDWSSDVCSSDLRRRGSREEMVYRVGDLELDRLSHRVARAEQEIDLQPREFRLLEYLMKHAGQVVTRTMLLENVWDYHF